MPRNYVAKKTYKAPGKLTPEKRAKFLEFLQSGISLAGAARAVGISHSCVYDWKAKDRDFAEAIDKAREAGSDRMEDALLDIGIRDKNVTALIFLLKGRRPDTYRDRQQTDLTNSDGSLAGLFAEAMMHGGDPQQRSTYQADAP